MKKDFFHASEKADIIKQHYMAGKPISDICAEYGIHVETFKKWEKKLFDNGEWIFKNVPKNGTEYFHNYDFVVNWLSDTFRGETLDFLGIKSAPIRRVSTFKHVDISVATGTLDIILEDMEGQCYHIEEQRNMSERDMYRFASQHFPAAKECHDNMMDIILISGKSYAGKKEIQTRSGKYLPVFVDLTDRDAVKRLNDIESAMNKGDMSGLLELVFVPLYGKEQDQDRNNLALKVIELELNLCKQKKISELILAATLILCNKILDQSTIEKIWEDIKMIDILKYAHDKGREAGRAAAHDMLFDILYSSFGIIPEKIADMIKSISHFETLKGLHRQAITCRDINQFEKTVMQVVKQDQAVFA